MDKLINSLFRPVDISSIVFIRILFGLLLFLQVGSYLFSGYIDQIWLEPDYHFKYYGFYWVKVLPSNFMYALVAGVSVSAFFIAIGFLYRISTVIFFLGFSYLFLLEQSVYLNHYYFVILVSFILIFIPANRYFSLDSVIWPKIKRAWICQLVPLVINISDQRCIYIRRYSKDKYGLASGLATLDLAQ